MSKVLVAALALLVVAFGVSVVGILAPGVNRMPVMLLGIAVATVGLVLLGNPAAAIKSPTRSGARRR
jgi:hypothetical protein